MITVKDLALSWRDIILIGGGLFLIAQGDPRNSCRGRGARGGRARRCAKASAFFWVIMQIIVIDMVFSLDSIITAIGMAQDIEIMVAAVVIACFVMYVSSGPVAQIRRRSSDHQDAGAGVPGADRGGAGGGRIQIPYPARLHLLCHRVFGGRRTVQRARQAQPPEGRQIAGFGRRVDNAAAMAFASLELAPEQIPRRNCHDQGRARAQGRGSGSPGV